MLMVKENSTTTVIFVYDFGQPDEKSVREVRRTLKYISRSLLFLLFWAKECILCAFAQPQL